VGGIRVAGGSSASAGQPPVEDDELLVRVAWYYYKDNLTQAAIAERLSVSRATAARLLERARARGIVKIDINTEALGAFHLSGRLKERYGLQDVLVVPRLESDTSAGVTNTRVAQAGAQYLRTCLRPGTVLGVGWGDTVVRTLIALSRESLDGVRLATLTGGIDAYLRTLAAGSTNGVLERIDIIPAPLLASSAHIAEALRAESTVRSVMDRAREADVALIGIGGALPDATAVYHGLVTTEQLQDYIAKGAIGDILGEWYDERGEVLAIDLQPIRIGLSIRALRDMTKVVAVAGGVAKTPAIRGALHGGYVDVLVTTEDVALALVEPDQT
jgi:Transcriptional regulator, contains sigma factor-related N-terminal domain